MEDDNVKVCDSSEIDICVSNRQDICFLCHRQFSKYTCPRCNASYCSTSCYKSEKHVQCSEDFYRQSVLCEISSRTKDPKDIEYMLTMLKALEKQDQGLEESVVPSLEERFANINLDSADIGDIWSELTPDERRDFQTRIQTGNLSHLIEEWIPWWQKNDGSTSIKAGIKVIASRDSQGETSNLHRSPHYPKKLEKIPASIATSNNPFIKYSIIDVLYAYVYVMRMFNGAAEENLHHAVMDFYQLASTLSNKLNFESVEAVVHNSLNAVIEYKDLCNSQEFSYYALSDVCDLLSGFYSTGEQNIAFVDIALSHVYSLLTKYKKALKSQMGSEKEDIKQIFLAKKKVVFFLSWQQSNWSTLSSLVPELKAVHYDLISNLKLHMRETTQIGKELKGKAISRKKLIEELSN